MQFRQWNFHNAEVENRLSTPGKGGKHSALSGRNRTGRDIRKPFSDSGQRPSTVEEAQLLACKQLLDVVLQGIGVGRLGVEFAFAVDGEERLAGNT